MSEVIDLDLVPLDYPSRLNTLLKFGVGLNDNDLCALLARHPNIRAIAFNGGTAAKLGMKVLGSHAADYQIAELPSSSPAYTLGYAEKAVRWRALRTILLGTQHTGEWRCEN